MNNTELTLDQLQAISGGQWRDVRDHNYGKLMFTRSVDSFNCDDILLGGAVRKDIVHPRLQPANELG